MSGSAREKDVELRPGPGRQTSTSTTPIGGSLLREDASSRGNPDKLIFLVSGSGSAVNTGRDSLGLGPFLQRLGECLAALVTDVEGFVADVANGVYVDGWGPHPSGGQSDERRQFGGRRVDPADDLGRAVREQAAGLGEPNPAANALKQPGAGLDLQPG